MARTGVDKSTNYQTILFLSLLLLSVFTGCDEKEEMVLSVNIPSTDYSVDLWEQPIRQTFPSEYKNWIVINISNSEELVYVIEDEYIEYRTVKVFYHQEKSVVRIETNGDPNEFHSIAIYNFKNKKFEAVSEESVENRKDWKLIKMEKIR